MNLKSLTEPILFKDINKYPDLALEIQTILVNLGLLYTADNTFGDRSINALVTFKLRNKLSGGNLLGITTATSLLLSTKTYVTKKQFNQIFSCAPKDYYPGLNAGLAKYGITSLSSIRHFLSQCGHESLGLIYMTEIADGSAYEGRRDLGNIREGDGKKFRGQSPIQMTGRANYQLFADHINDQRVMEGWQYVASKYVWEPSMFFWLNNNLNTLANSGASVKDITLVVNGGTNGLESREKWYEKVSHII